MFNCQLKQELRRYEETVVTESVGDGAPIRKADAEPNPRKIYARGVEKVVGGDIRWKPVDRQSAMLMARSPWWARPPLESPKLETEQETKPKRKRKHMKGAFVESGVMVNQEYAPANGNYIAKSGLPVTMVNGEAFVRPSDMDFFLAEAISKMPAETRPNVLAAQDARKIIHELLDGIGGEMEKFNANSKKYLEDIRQTRFAVVSETATMTKELKDVRQFFLGSDYQEQVARLRDFVDLCERLQKLKQTGFLDSVADTMLRLAER